MSALDELLQLQEHDTTIDQLRHKLATLPDRDRVRVNAEHLVQLEREVAEVRARRDELAREQRRLEDEVAVVEAKASEVDKTLYSGTVTSPRELQALQEDFNALKRRQAVLEDQVLAVMEQSEPVDERLAALSSRRGELDAEAVLLTASLAEAESQVEAELAVAAGEREEIVPSVPAELRDEYERLRPRFGGIAVARLVGSNCGGCHLTLSAVALDRIRNQPVDALATCEECGRILVR